MILALRFDDGSVTERVHFVAHVLVDRERAAFIQEAVAAKGALDGELELFHDAPDHDRAAFVRGSVGARASAAAS